MYCRFWSVDPTSRHFSCSYKFRNKWLSYVHEIQLAYKFLLLKLFHWSLFYLIGQLLNKYYNSTPSHTNLIQSTFEQVFIYHKMNTALFTTKWTGLYSRINKQVFIHTKRTGLYLLPNEQDFIYHQMNRTLFTTKWTAL